MAFGTPPSAGNLIIVVVAGRVYSGSPPYSGTPSMSAGSFSVVGSNSNANLTAWSMVAPPGLTATITLPTITGSFNAVGFFAFEVANQGTWGASIGATTCDSSGNTVAPTVDAGNAAFLLQVFANFTTGGPCSLANPTAGTTVGGYRDVTTATDFGMGWISGNVTGSIIPQVTLQSHPAAGTYSGASFLLGYVPTPTYCWVRQKNHQYVQASTPVLIYPP